MQGTLAANAIRWTITGSQAAGGLAGSPGTEVQIINEALQAVARRYPWRWLTRTTQPLSLIADQPYVDLPKDCDEVLEVVRGPGLLTWMEPATEIEMLELRAGTIPRGDSFGFYYTVEHVERRSYNLTTSPEDFQAAEWVASAATVTSGGLSPQGVSEAQTITGTTTSGALTQTGTFDSAIEHGRTFIASLFVKAGTSLASEVTLRQSGAGGQTTSRSPLTTARINWSAGVPTVALQASQGPGAHDVGVEAYADGWYRVWVLITIDLDEAIPSEALQFVIRPAALAAGATLVTWGAQLEEHTGHQIDSSLIRPRRYSVPSTTPSDLVRQLSIWPTPIETRPAAFLLRYRRKPPQVLFETDNIAVPWFLDGVVLEACRAVARGWHSEDSGRTFERLDAVWSSQDFASAVERDDDTQRKLGPMRGTAAEMLGRGGRDWGHDTVVPPPGGLA